MVRWNKRFVSSFRFANNQNDEFLAELASPLGLCAQTGILSIHVHLPNIFFWWMILGFENELEDDINRNMKYGVLRRKNAFWINRNVLFGYQFIVHILVVHWWNTPSSLSPFQVQLDALISSKRRLHPAWVGVEE